MVTGEINNNNGGRTSFQEREKKTGICSPRPGGTQGRKGERHLPWAKGNDAHRKRRGRKANLPAPHPEEIVSPVRGKKILKGGIVWNLGKGALS